MPFSQAGLHGNPREPPHFALCVCVFVCVGGSWVTGTKRSAGSRACPRGGHATPVLGTQGRPRSEARCVSWPRFLQEGRGLDYPTQPTGLCPIVGHVAGQTMSCVLVGFALGVLSLSLPWLSLGGAGALQTIWISAGGAVGSSGSFPGSRQIGNTR